MSGVDAGVRNDLCRVTVIAPGARLDVALPAQVPLAELLPTLLRETGADPVQGGGGWSLQRFGQAPLDTGLTATAHGLLDGEVLHLRPRQAELPELAFDDVADAVATAASQRTRRWSGADTRRTGLVTAGAVLVACALLVLASGPPWTVPAIASGAVAAALLGVGAVLSRAFSDARAGLVPAGAAIGFAAICGAVALAGDDAPARFAAPSLLGAAAGTLLATALATLAVADGVPGLVGVAVAALVAVGGAAVDLATPAGTAGSAALVAVVALGLTPMVPPLALRLAELPLPAIPFTADDVRRDDTRVDGADVLRRTVVADAYLTGVVGAIAALVAGCEALLCARHDALPLWLTAVTAASCALRARSFAGRLQRAFLLGASGVGVVAVTASLTTQETGTRRLLVLALPLLVLFAVLLTAALRLPRTPPTPVWRRAADILDGLVVVSLIPLALGVLGVYSYVRGLAG